MIAAQENAKLAVPSNPQDWLADRKARLTIALKRLARAARNGTIPHGSIEDGTLRIEQIDSRRAGWCRGTHTGSVSPNAVRSDYRHAA